MSAGSHTGLTVWRISGDRPSPQGPDDVDLAHGLTHIPPPAPSRPGDKRHTGAELHRRAVFARDGRVAGQHVHVLTEARILPFELSGCDLPDAALHDIVAIELQDGR